MPIAQDLESRIRLDGTNITQNNIDLAIEASKLITLTEGIATDKLKKVAGTFIDKTKLGGDAVNIAALAMADSDIKGFFTPDSHDSFQDKHIKEFFNNNKLDQATKDILILGKYTEHLLYLPNNTARLDEVTKVIKNEKSNEAEQHLLEAYSKLPPLNNVDAKVLEEKAIKLVAATVKSFENVEEAEPYALNLHMALERANKNDDAIYIAGRTVTNLNSAGKADVAKGNIAAAVSPSKEDPLGEKAPAPNNKANPVTELQQPEASEAKSGDAAPVSSSKKDPLGEKAPAPNNKANPVTELQQPEASEAKSGDAAPVSPSKEDLLGEKAVLEYRIKKHATPTSTEAQAPKKSNKANLVTESQKAKSGDAAPVSPSKEDLLGEKAVLEYRIKKHATPTSTEAQAPKGKNFVKGGGLLFVGALLCATGWGAIVGVPLVLAGAVILGKETYRTIKFADDGKTGSDSQHENNLRNLAKVNTRLEGKDIDTPKVNKEMQKEIESLKQERVKDHAKLQKFEKLLEGYHGIRQSLSAGAERNAPGPTSSSSKKGQYL